MDYDYLDDEDNRDSLKEWILKNFSRRECSNYIASNNENFRPYRTIWFDRSQFLTVFKKWFGCGCGRRRDDHRRLDISSSLEEINITKSQCSDKNGESIWRIKDNTEVLPTNAFGTLEFQGAEIHTTKAEYIRLSFDTKPQNIIKLLKNYWQLELPKLIISVHGGIANYGLQPKLKQAIQRGLIKVANTSHIWLITAGTDTGVVKHIGDILREYFPKSRNNVVVIGIAPWGVVNERESLIGQDIEVPYYTNPRTISSGPGFNLNNCHSYFLLVDDGTVGKYGCEISFRRRFERFLSRHKSEIFMDFDLRPKKCDVTIEEKSDLFIYLSNILDFFDSLKIYFNKVVLLNHHTIPLVCLVIEGGTNTIQTVLVNVNDKPPVPVVICDGSGRAADLIAFTHKYVYINPLTKRATMETDVKEQLISTIMKTFAYTRSQADYLFIQLINCVSNKDLISIYRLGDEENQEIDLAILTASLKVIDLQLSKQMDTIMSWNRPDVAKKYILLQGSNEERQILEEKMFDALSQDKVDFVKLLLEYGVNIQKFLTIKRLEDLYNFRKGPANTLALIVKDVIKSKITTNYQILLPDIGLVIEKLMGSGYVSEYSKREFKAKYYKYLCKKSGNTFLNGMDSSHTNEKEETYNFPYNELLIWAVLMKRHKMALFLCKRGEETLAKALVAAKLNKALAREAEEDDLDSEIYNEFKQYEQEFASLAYGLLDKCYKEDDELTSQLLTYDLVNWSHWTCLSLAVSGNLKDFLSHTACQLLISDLWMGGMKIRKYVTWKIITALLFPPAIFTIQFKSAKELQYMPQTQEEHEQELENQDILSHGDSERENFNTHEQDNDLHEKEYSDTDHNELSSHHLVGSNNIIDNANETGYRKEKNNILSLDQIIELYDAQSLVNDKKANNKHLINNKKGGSTDRQINREKQTVNFMIRKRSNKLKWGKKIYEFYNAPITKFWQNTIIYIFFLFCFGYIVLIRTPEYPSWSEIFVLVYIFSYGIDKIRELLQTDSPRFSGKIKIFFSKVMNSLDVFFIFTIIIALIFRIIPHFLKDPKYPSNNSAWNISSIAANESLSNLTNLMLDREASADDFEISLKSVARLIYCVNTIFWMAKLMEFLVINKYTGPLIIIASRMLIDLFNFVVLLIIVLLSYGLSRQAIKFPNKDFEWDLVKSIFLEPYFMLYGEVYADTIDPPCEMFPNNTMKNPYQPECQPGHWITVITMTAFMVISVLLFLTILIASFNSTFMRISKQSSQFWKCQRYHFVTAYELKPLFAPPLVIISLIYMIAKYMVRVCQGKKIKFDRKLKSFLSEDMVQRLHDFEENCFYIYRCELDELNDNLLEEKVKHTSNKVENISARIDDIFFKESMTKLSLYKVELRLQKLEECTYETINILNNLIHSNKSLLKNVDINRDQMTFYERPRTMSTRIRNNTVTDTSYYANQMFSRQVSRTSMRGNPVNSNNVDENNRNMVFNSWEGKENIEQKKNNLREENSNDEKNFSSHQEINHKEIKQRKKNSSESQSQSAIVLKRATSVLKNRTPSSNKVNRNDKNSDTEEEISIIRNNLNSLPIQHNLEDTTEAKYFDHFSKKLASKNKKRISNSISSESSSDEIKNNASRFDTDSNVFEEDHWKYKQDRKIKSDRKNSDRNGDSSDSDDSEKNIISSIYKSTLEQQQQILLNSQLSNGIDQYTLHSFSYLHPVAKPPLAEYTSITDCIDTSTIDRPPSPPILSFNNKLTSKIKMENSAQISTGKVINATKTYCSQESARSAVARQESEILRLAEESQHVIISQMLNKLVKKGDFNSSETNSNSKNIKESNENTEKPSLNSDETTSQMKASCSSISNLGAENLLNEKTNRLHFKIETSSKESLKANEKENTKEEIDILKTTVLNEEDETKKKDSSLNTPKKKKSSGTLGASMKKFLTPDIPLHAIDRKSSQIFYAQSQAKTLCMNFDDEKEEDEDAQRNKNEKLFLRNKNIDENDL